MRIAPNESYESWAQRVQQFELDRARRDLAKGTAVDKVIETLANRIRAKMMHPLLDALHKEPDKFDLEASKKAYEEAYLKLYGPKSDHVLDD